MNNIKVYLSGACANVDTSFQTWRVDFLKCIDDICYEDDIKIIDPNLHFDYQYNKPKTDKECHNLFYYLIEKSDVLVVNLDHTKLSPGAVAEVHHAYMKGIPVIGFGSASDSWYSWAVEECSTILSSIDEVIEYLYMHYLI